VFSWSSCGGGTETSKLSAWQFNKFSACLNSDWLPYFTQSFQNTFLSRIWLEFVFSWVQNTRDFLFADFFSPTQLVSTPFSHPQISEHTTTFFKFVQVWKVILFTFLSNPPSSFIKSLLSIFPFTYLFLSYLFLIRVYFIQRPFLCFFSIVPLSVSSALFTSPCEQVLGHEFIGFIRDVLTSSLLQD